MRNASALAEYSFEDITGPEHQPNRLFRQMDPYGTAVFDAETMRDDYGVNGAVSVMAMCYNDAGTAGVAIARGEPQPGKNDSFRFAAVPFNSQGLDRTHFMFDLAVPLSPDGGRVQFERFAHLPGMDSRHAAITDHGGVWFTSERRADLPLYDGKKPTGRLVIDPGVRAEPKTIWIRQHAPTLRGI